MIPGKSKQSPHGNGRRLNANRSAQGLDLKVVYKIDGPENQYRQILPTCTIEARLSGTIAIENMSQNRHEHNYELAMGRNNGEFKHSMSQFSDHAFKDLTQGVSLDFKSGAVNLQAPIMYKAGLGPYTVAVQAENPLTLKGTFKPGLINAESAVGEKKYKYTAEIQFDVTVTLNPTSRKELEPGKELSKPNYLKD